MGVKIITDSGEVITFNNLIDRAIECCVFRPKVQRFYEAHCDLNILTEDAGELSTQRVKAGDKIIIDPKFYTAHGVSNLNFQANYDIINAVHTTSEC